MKTGCRAQLDEPDARAATDRGERAKGNGDVMARHKVIPESGFESRRREREREVHVGEELLASEGG